MSKIVLLSCVSKKLSHPAKAKQLYISPLFRLAYKYAQKLQPNLIFILSAKYGLLQPDQEVEPYDQTLHRMTSEQRKKWAGNILNQLGRHCDLQRDEFVILAGHKYRQYLIPHLAHYKTPLQGLGIGKQLRYLKRT